MRLTVSFLFTDNNVLLFFHFFLLQYAMLLVTDLLASIKKKKVNLGVESRKFYCTMEGLKNKDKELIFHIICNRESLKAFKMENDMKILEE